MFEGKVVRTGHTGYFFFNVEIKDYTMLWLMEKSFFDQPVKNDLKTFDNIWETSSGQGVDYTIGCLLNYSYFKKTVQDDSNRLKHITSTWCWSKSNTKN